MLSTLLAVSVYYIMRNIAQTIPRTHFPKLIKILTHTSLLYCRIKHVNTINKVNDNILHILNYRNATEISKVNWNWCIWK